MNRAPDTPRQRARNRVVLLVVATIAAVGSILVHGPGNAAATPGDEVEFVAALNKVRAEHGVPPLRVNDELADLARAHAQLMADAGEIFHADPISAGFTGEWAKLGENVGVGADVNVLVDAFVKSEGHFANIIDPSFAEIGVGVVWNGSALYTTHRFLQPPGTTAPATSAPTDPTTPPGQPPTPTTPAPTTTTTTTLAPIPPPAIRATRVIALLEMVDRVGT